MDPSGAEFTMHHPNHHHPHYHHYPNGAPSSGPTPRCPALRASAAEQRNYQLPMISPSRVSRQYDPVHSHSGSRDMWQSRTRQNWQPAMIPPYSQDTMMVGTFPGPTPSNQPAQPQLQSHAPCPMPATPNTLPGSENYQPQGPPYHSLRTIMHPVPRMLNQPSYQNLGGLAGPNSSPYNPQHAPNRPMQGMNSGLPTSPSIHSSPPTQVPVSRPPTNPMQMGQAGSYANDNIGPSQQLPNLLPHIMASQDHSSSFSRQASEPTAQSTSPAEESNSHQVAQPSSTPTSAAQQRANDQTARMINNPVDIRRAPTAAISRARRTMPRFGPLEWLGGENTVVFRRGDTSLMELVDNNYSAVANGENPTGDRIFRSHTGGKRIASKKALASLQSVDIADLPESERTCVICYNDFGVANPEGINEAPLRLPKCKHVFGDHCIKKWFQESDSCPYCRDKVPSEPQPVPSRRGHPSLRFVNPYHTMAQHLAAYHAHGQSPPSERDATESELAAQPGQSVGGNTTDRSSQFPEATNARSPTGNRRFENIHQPHNMRAPAGNATNAAYERRSPPAEYDRRRRSRHRVRITSPPSRLTQYGASTLNGMPQTSVRSSRSSRSRSPFDHTNMNIGANSSNRRSLTNSPEQYQWNGSPPPHSNPIGGAVASSPQGSTAYDTSTLNFQSRADNFFSGLVSFNPDVIPSNEHPSRLPQMRSNADVFVPSGPAHADSNQFTSHQRS